MSRKEARKPKVFLSSPIEGLEDLRSVLIPAISEKLHCDVFHLDRTCRGILTGDSDVKELCLRNVRESDWFFLIVDKRYGNPNYWLETKDRKCSLTELEYYQAIQVQIPITIFCRNEVWYVYKVWTKNKDIKLSFKDGYDHLQFLMEFMDMLKEKGGLINRFENAQEIIEMLPGIQLSLEVTTEGPIKIPELATEAGK